jgi:hypothetical protein
MYNIYVENNLRRHTHIDEESVVVKLATWTMDLTRRGCRCYTIAPVEVTPLAL